MMSSHGEYRSEVQTTCVGEKAELKHAAYAIQDDKAEHPLTPSAMQIATDMFIKYPGM